MEFAILLGVVIIGVLIVLYLKLKPPTLISKAEDVEDMSSATSSAVMESFYKEVTKAELVQEVEKPIKQLPTKKISTNKQKAVQLEQQPTPNKKSNKPTTKKVQQTTKAS